MRTDNLYSLPADLPLPLNDGACDHLLHSLVPDISLPATSGCLVSLAEKSEMTRVVVYCYPRTGKPDIEPPTGWDQIPGARGCTPQSCSFRDRYQELKFSGCEVFGLSTQTTDYQREAAQRLHLPFPLLSDETLEFASTLKLPVFEVDGMNLIKRLTLIIAKRRIIQVFYPVFPPDQNAHDVARWLQENPS
ncbi:MAG TPA: peroxiredoxin [Abditibacteriaceae bacterium]|jgi:peroxiredoxin